MELAEGETLADHLSHGPVPLDDPIEKHMADRCPWVRTDDAIADVLEAMQLKNMRMSPISSTGGKKNHLKTKTGA